MLYWWHDVQENRSSPETVTVLTFGRENNGYCMPSREENEEAKGHTLSRQIASAEIVIFSAHLRPKTSSISLWVSFANQLCTPCALPQPSSVSIYVKQRNAGRRFITSGYGVTRKG
ncbi:uncharacterized protein MCYG_05870 [Microsporum canis CBS 113480]|uniref:Uncharacterized protein n=1 Tax=Arthroderma otae (strain ATCC MYA-4605 / CBS 113480) TaxID=554155 RepID=C5FT48_ARTOC|nr:uncharacterized protein MCYG_05870 [Microsporum canis CBS 113480]EEQ33051.1 predicted protein [Microsporum canis CBS 113480]